MRVLLVEDEFKIANALKKGLAQEGYAVDMYHDADEGLNAALNDPVDIAILDRMLPGLIDGIGIVKELRKAKPLLPIIFLTAKDAISDRVAGLDAGANDYLVKPFAFEELLARVRVLTRVVGQESHDALTYRDMSLNLKTKMLTRDGKNIELSKTEFSLLDYMIRNPEIVLSKQNIIDHVWDYDADVLPNTVEVFVGMLRNKIDKPFKKQGSYIQTVRGFGYKLELKI